MRALFLAACLMVAFAKSMLGADPNLDSLRGRWRASTVETGYWIIDRYPDGRFAQKQFLTFDYRKPSEVVVSWGRWRLQGTRYLSIIEGSTSATVRRFAGKWRATPLVSLSAQRFEFRGSEGYPRYEQREPGTEPLVDLALPPPSGLSGPNRGVLETDLKTVPAWVNRHP